MFVHYWILKYIREHVCSFNLCTLQDKFITSGRSSSCRQYTNILVNALGLCVANNGLTTQRFHVRPYLITNLHPPLLALLLLLLLVGPAQQQLHRPGTNHATQCPHKAWRKVLHCQEWILLKTQKKTIFDWRLVFVSRSEISYQFV